MSLTEIWFLYINRLQSWGLQPWLAQKIEFWTDGHNSRRIGVSSRLLAEELQSNRVYLLPVLEMPDLKISLENENLLSYILEVLYQQVSYMDAIFL